MTIVLIDCDKIRFKRQTRLLTTAVIMNMSGGKENE